MSVRTRVEWAGGVWRVQVATLIYEFRTWEIAWQFVFRCRPYGLPVLYWHGRYPMERIGGLR